MQYVVKQKRWHLKLTAFLIKRYPIRIELFSRALYYELKSDVAYYWYEILKKKKGMGDIKYVL